MKLINSVETALDEMIKGILLAQPQEFERIDNEYSYALIRKKRVADRVRIMVNGGGGWGPMFPGFVGEGLADAMVHGDFNCAPNAWLIYETAYRIHTGKGVFILANNYSGDYLNNDMARELLERKKVPVGVCYVSDDVCSAKGEEKEKRGGMSGILLLLKIASALAETGADVKTIERVTEKANACLRSIVICCNEEENVIEFGNGFSGEPPVCKETFVSADRTAARCMDLLMTELEEYKKDRKLHIVVNRMRKMSYLEGYVMLQSLVKELEMRRYSVESSSVGGYFDAFESNGCIVSVLACDEELEMLMRQVKGYDFTI